MTWAHICVHKFGRVISILHKKKKYLKLKKLQEKLGDITPQIFVITNEIYSTTFSLNSHNPWYL